MEKMGDKRGSKRENGRGGGIKIKNKSWRNKMDQTGM